MRRICNESEVEIVRLHFAEHWPIGTIGRHMGLHHSVVRRVLGRHGIPVPQAMPRTSMVDPYRPFILDILEKYPRIRASRLFHMVKSRGYTGGPSHFRALVSLMRPRRKSEAYVRLRYLPGEQAQVDWACFGRVQVGRATRPLFAFVMVLCYSRMAFLRFSFECRMPSFLRSHVEAFEFFGRVARTCLYDNLKSAVVTRVGDAIQWNPTLLACAKHYRFGPRAAAPYRGNEKGRVERHIRYIRENFFAARPFSDLDTLNREARAWCTDIAAKRPWPDDPKKTVEDAFQDELASLLELPHDRFPYDERLDVKVGKTPYVRFDRNDYSVPHTYVRRHLQILASEHEVRVCEGDTVVSHHARSFDQGQRIEAKEHIDALLAEKRAARKLHGQCRLLHAVPATEVFIHRAAERGHNLGNITKRMLDLLDEFGAQDLAAVMDEVNLRDTVHVPSVRQLLEQRRRVQQRPLSTKVELSSPQLREIVVTPHDLRTYDQLHAAEEGVETNEEGDDDGHD